MSNQKVHVKKGDNVYVLSGKNRGRKGKILKVFPEDNRVLVESVNIAVKHKKARGTNPGGIIRQEAAIHASNVMLICEKCKAPTKSGKKMLANGEKARVCKRCGEIIDTVISAD